MTPEQWEKVNEVLVSALELAPENRRAYLDERCADSSLRREVELLIAAHENGGSQSMGESSFVSGPGSGLADGEKLGAYVILGPLGAGGMGEVYCARDSKLNREVAIKVLPRAVAHDPERLSRFQREASCNSAICRRCAGEMCRKRMRIFIRFQTTSVSSRWTGWVHTWHRYICVVSAICNCIKDRKRPLIFKCSSTMPA